MNSVRPVPVVLHRQDLYDEVWSRPCTRIAASLGISSSALKRICTAMDIPTPPVGHWTQMQFGKSIAKAALPMAGPKTRLQWQVDLENSLSQKHSGLVSTARSIDGPEGCERQDNVPQIQLAKDLENLHPLVKATRAQWRESRGRTPWEKRQDRKRFNASVSLASKDGKLSSKMTRVPHRVRHGHAVIGPRSLKAFPPVDQASKRRTLRGCKLSFAPCLISGQGGTFQELCCSATRCFRNILGAGVLGRRRARRHTSTLPRDERLKI